MIHRCATGPAPSLILKQPSYLISEGGAVVESSTGLSNWINCYDVVGDGGLLSPLILDLNLLGTTLEARLAIDPEATDQSYYRTRFSLPGL